MESKNYKNGYKTIRQCLLLNTEDIDVIFESAIICLEIGKRKEAVNHFTTLQGLYQTLELSGSSKSELSKIQYKIQYSKALLEVFDGKFEEAAKMYRECLDPNYGDTHPVHAGNLAVCAV